MSKLPFFLLPTLLASTSALALSCYDGSTGCFKPDDVEQPAEDCRNLGYSLNEPECEHYLLCPFNTDYKICVKEKDGNTPDPTQPYDCKIKQTYYQGFEKYNFYLMCSGDKCDKKGTNGYTISGFIGVPEFMSQALEKIDEADSDFGDDSNCPMSKRCRAAELSFALAIDYHNEKCPDNQVTGKPGFSCNLVWTDDGSHGCRDFFESNDQI